MENTQRYFIVFVYLTALILTSLVQEISTEIYYCENNQEIIIPKVASGTIITRQSGSNHYDNSLSCAWRMHTRTETGYIHLSVVSTDLQWAPIGAICVGYDYITVYNGTDSSAVDIVTWCGEQNPRSVTTAGPEIRVTFTSNDRNLRNFAGAQLDFTVLERAPGLGNCPPGWFDNPTLPDGGTSCYSLKTSPDTWTKAQDYCNHDNANLVSMETEDEEQFIADWVSSSSAVSDNDQLWLSLNDIEVDGDYRWIDGTRASYYRWSSSDHTAEGYYNCVVMDKTGRWSEGFCNEHEIQSTVTHKYICETNKVAQTQKYDVPSTRTERGGKHTSSPEKTWIIIGCLFALVVAVVIIVVSIVCLMRKKKAKKAAWRQNSRDDPQSNRPIRSEHRSTEDIARPAATATAPPYTGSNPSLGGGEGQAPTVVLVFPSSDPPPTYDESKAHATAQ